MRVLRPFGQRRPACQAIAADGKLQARVIKSYELMLDFYGMRLVDLRTGTRLPCDHADGGCRPPGAQ